jgi:hypothetical protein
MEISSALPDMNFGADQEVNDDDDVYLGQGKNRIPRVSYDKDKNNGDLSSIDIYKQYLDDEDEDANDGEQTPYDSERRRNKLDRYVIPSATKYNWWRREQGAIRALQSSAE